MSVDWTGSPLRRDGVEEGSAPPSPPSDLTQIIAGYDDVVFVLFERANKLREQYAHPDRIRVIEDAARLWRRHVHVLREVQREEEARAAHMDSYRPEEQGATGSPLSRDQENAYR